MARLVRVPDIVPKRIVQMMLNFVLVLWGLILFYRVNSKHRGVDGNLPAEQGCLRKDYFELANQNPPSLCEGAKIELIKFNVAKPFTNQLQLSHCFVPSYFVSGTFN
jgi:hypothetical protein